MVEKPAIGSTFKYVDKLNPWSSHSVMASMLEGLPAGAKVLDIGIASGVIARLCAGRGFIIKGIEPKVTQLGDSTNLYKDIYEGDLEYTPDTFIGDQSAVVCGDVLEHLVHPEEQLKRLAKLQPAGCLFIISVPNIANIWIRINLLLGRFNYTNRGILDSTHLHFYTRKTFLNLMHTSGLQVKALHSTPIPLELVHIFFSHNSIGRILYSLLAHLTKQMPALLGYQWVAEAYKFTE